MTILDTIVADKQPDLAKLPTNIKAERSSKVLPFYEQVYQSDTLCVIGEVKRASPSKGNIKMDVEPVKQAQAYQAGHADAISVLTEEHHFKGSFADLAAVKQNVNIPVLNKDFIIDKRQITNAYNNGADIILLIVTLLTDDQLKDFHDYANELGLNILVEVHDEAEMIRALNIRPRMIGINNRNLKTFKVDIANTEQLLTTYYQEDIIFVAESGIRSTKAAKRMQAAGASVLLVGEYLMENNDPTAAIQSLKVDRHG